MTMDFDLISANEISINKALVERQATPVPWGFYLKDILTQEMLIKAINEFRNNQQWEKLEMQPYAGRHRIPWKDDSVIAEIHIAFSRLEHRISAICNKELKFSSVDWWQDDETYTILPHLDNDRISAAVQIYIDESGPDSGTEFYSNNQLVYKAPWQSNCGYMLINTPDSVHGMMCPGYKRHSLYAIFN